MNPGLGAVKLGLEYGPLDDASRLGYLCEGAWVVVRPMLNQRLTQPQIDAVTSLAVDVINHGVGSLEDFKKLIMDPINKRHWQVACAGFTRFTIQRGRMYRWVVDKRQEEQVLFRSGM